MTKAATKMCLREYDRIDKRTDPKSLKAAYTNIDLSHYTEYDETVVLVIHIIGLVGYMGFDSLFSDEIPGDPRYRRSISAYDRIGAVRASQILKEAVGIYFPSKTGAARDSVDRKAIASELEDRFADEENNVFYQLSKYIANNKPIRKGSRK